MQFGGIILCGGQSTRMGQPKAWLPWHEETVLAWLVRVLSQVVSPVVVVAAPQQVLPQLPCEPILTHDAFAHCGPLAGLEAGWSVLESHVSAAFVTGCDYPLLTPAFVTAMCQRLDDHEIAAPDDGEFLHPLLAVYQRALLPRIRQHLTEQRLSLMALCAASRTQRVSLDALRAIDPELRSLYNVNTPENYEQALRWSQGQN
jgi:molybdenum cofactor guanylyltransferase